MKFTKFLTAFAVCAVLATSFTSCKDDEPKDNGDNTENNGGNNNGGTGSNGTGAQYASKAILKVDGEFITELSYLDVVYKFTYDNEGRITEIKSNYDEFIKIDYSTNTFSNSDSESGKISFNSNGYISGYSGSWKEESDGWIETGEGTASFNYDSNGNLISHNITSNGTDTNLSENYTGKWSGSDKGNYTWNNGNLISASLQGQENEDGEIESWGHDYTLSYGSQANKYLQMPTTLANQMLFGHPMDLLATIGLFGKGPAFLPTKLFEVYKEDKEEIFTQEFQMSFDLNSNGSIDTEESNYYTYSYWYGDDDQVDNGPSKSTSLSSRRNTFSMKNLFGKAKK